MAKQQSDEVGISREGSVEPGTLIRNVPAAAGPVLPNGSAPLINPDAVKRELQRLQHNSKQTHMSRRKSHIPVERAYQVEEFLQRKREAVLNKVRAEGQLEYLTRLRQIRLQNFNERQQIKARLRGEKYNSDGSDSQESSEEAELRRKKIVAFKAQANARAALLKEQLERKRREANEREKKAWDDHIAAQEDSVCMAAVPPTSQPTIVKTSSALPESEPPTPVISMTVALNNVGANAPLKENLSGIVSQSEKKQILNRLNQNLKAPSPVDEVLESAPTAPKEEILASQQKLLETENLPSMEERKKWDPAELPVLPTSQPTLEDFCTIASRDRPPSGGDRKKWDEGLPFVFSVAQQTLEETCVPTIEQTVGEVVQMGVLQGEGQRKLWGVSPDCQILKVLHEAEVQPLTKLLETVSVCEEASPSPDEPNQIVAEHEMSTPEEDMSSKDGTPAIIEVQVQTEYVATTEVSHPENASEIEGHTKPTSIAEIQDPEDVESMVLEDVPKASPTSMELHHAWAKQDQPPLLPELNTNQGAASGKEGVSQGEEPLFMKLCSPAHRRTSALVLFSAQSSVDESSSSLASRSRSVSPMRSKQHNALLIGLSTGLFDANNPKMLRTCSLPDLSRVFSAEKDSVITTEDSIAPDGNQGNEDQDEGKDDDQSDAYEDEDLRDIRASMEQLLQEENDFMRNRPHDGRGDFNGNATIDEDKDFFNRIIVELEQQNDQMTVADDDDDDVEDDDEDGEDEECLNGSPVEEEAGELLSNGVREETHTNKSQFNEEWQSDNSEEDQEGESRLYDSIYSRLEEHRFNLEQQMGFEKFIEAYNKIKAIRDADDDNIDLGSNLAFSILGNEHQHLYPNILHLVMADGAYQEGNDKRFEQWSHWQP